jgi:ribosomal-protein-alanine N-acetyltransferase
MSRFILETPRLILRQFTLEDHPALAAMHRDPVVMWYLGGSVDEGRSLEMLKGYMAFYRDPGYSKWAVVLRETGELIGRCGPIPDSVEGRAEVELGYTFATSHWGKGYATEAAAAARAHCFERLGLTRIISIIDPHNTASQRVALRLGMRHERDAMWRGSLKRIYALERNAGKR